MSAGEVERRLRGFLFGLAGALCLGIIVELALTGHTQQPIQWLPFGLAGLGLVVVGAAWWRPNRITLWTLRLSMGLLALGGALGSYEHVQSNLEIVRETQPNLALPAAVGKALSGAAPLLAPGILAVAALIAVAATYYHPALGQRPVGRPSA